MAEPNRPPEAAEDEPTDPAIGATRKASGPPLGAAVTVARADDGRLRSAIVRLDATRRHDHVTAAFSALHYVEDVVGQSGMTPDATFEVVLRAPDSADIRAVLAVLEDKLRALAVTRAAAGSVLPPVTIRLEDAATPPARAVTSPNAPPATPVLGWLRSLLPRR